MSHFIYHNQHDLEGAVSKDTTALRAIPHTSKDELSRVDAVEAHFALDSRLVMQTEPYSMEADRFRALRVYLRALAKTRGVRTLMVTSAFSGEGKSVSSLNLATALAEQGESSILLVEADLRSPTLSHRLGLPESVGLTDCLEDDVDPLHAIRYERRLGIYILPAGKPCGNPVETLNSETFMKLVQRLRHLADWVILDCPPVLPVPDAFAIRSTVDGCVWVVRADSSSRHKVKEAMQMLGRELVVSLILNDAKIVDRSNSSYYHHPAGTHMLGRGA